MMELMIKFKCTCGCSYSINEKTNAKEVSCPNCGKVVNDSDKFVSMFKLANEIKEPNILEHGIYYSVTSHFEELKNSLQLS